MATKDEFKNFAKTHPELVHYIKNGESTWQKFFEIYDIYGEDENAWQDYFKKTDTSSSSSYNFKSFTDKLKNIDLSAIQEHIGTAQKALGIVQELTTKGTGAAVGAEAAEIVNPRPINKIFED